MKLQHLFEYQMETPRRKRVTGKSPEDFVQYMRSTKDIWDAMGEKYGPGAVHDPKLEYIVALFAHHNMAVADNVVINVDPENLYKYREYDRDPSDGYTGKHSSDEYEELKSAIEKNGITEPLTLTLKRLRDGDVEVYLGEGNHRLRIAMETGIEYVPLRFIYYK